MMYMTEKEREILEHIDENTGRHLKSMMDADGVSNDKMGAVWNVSGSDVGKICRGVQGMNVKKLAPLLLNFGYSADEIIWGSEYADIVSSYKRKYNKTNERDMAYFTEDIQRIRLTILQIRDDKKREKVLKLYMDGILGLAFKT